jgi:acyl dehydratase
MGRPVGVLELYLDTIVNRRTEAMRMATEHSPESQPLYLEDLSAGQRFKSGTYLVEEAAIRAFGGQFDPQPFHMDPEAARRTLFEGLVASGWHTAAITMRLLVTGGLRLAGGLIGTGATISWPKPTRPGDLLRVESELVEVRASRSRPDRGTATFRCNTLNQRDEVVQTFTGTLLVWRRDGGIHLTG